MKMDTVIRSLPRSLADKKRATPAGGAPGPEFESMRQGLTYYSHHQNGPE
jgi:hypothetical protein